MPPVLDIEILSNGYSPENTVKGIKNWLVIIEKYYGVKPIIYTNIDFYNKYLADKELEDYPWWIAHYYKNKLSIDKKWHFWQHNDKGKVNGIKGDVDFNVFYGTIKDLEKISIK